MKICCFFIFPSIRYAHSYQSYKPRESPKVGLFIIVNTVHFFVKFYVLSNKNVHN